MAEPEPQNLRLCVQYMSNMRAGGEAMEVTRVRITDAGRWLSTGSLDSGAT
jgi:hypothetical protein